MCDVIIFCMGMYLFIILVFSHCYQFCVLFDVCGSSTHFGDGDLSGFSDLFLESLGTGCSFPGGTLGVKRPGREADHSPPSSAEVKECVELRLHGVVLSQAQGCLPRTRGRGRRKSL
jgi:hypothetical protein